MRRPQYIPPEVQSAISSHIDEAVANAVRAFPAGAEDEDALTGQLGYALRIDEQAVTVQGEVAGIWRWSIDYTKFRGRGKGAAENTLGADGILELRTHHAQGSDTKAALFQSKTKWSGRDEDLSIQCLKLSTWAEASFVIDYRPDGFSAYRIEDVIRARGTKTLAVGMVSLQTFLNEAFLGCVIGDSDLKYDRDERLLIWRTRDGVIVATQFAVGSRFRINVKWPRTEGRFDKLVEPGEVYRFRMDASPEDILNLPTAFTKADLKKAKREAALTYHPDQFTIDAPPIIINIVNLRMQEKMEAEQALQDELQEGRDARRRRKH
jgi:hypothetical protein